MAEAGGNSAITLTSPEGTMEQSLSPRPLGFEPGNLFFDLPQADLAIRSAGALLAPQPRNLRLKTLR